MKGPYRNQMGPTYLAIEGIRLQNQMDYPIQVASNCSIKAGSNTRKLISEPQEASFAAETILAITNSIAMEAFAIMIDYLAV